MTARSGRSDNIGDKAAAGPNQGIGELTRSVAAIARSIDDRAALENQLTVALAELVELREIRAEARSMHDAAAQREEHLARAEAALQSSETTMRDLSQSLAGVLTERDATEETLQSLKKKYRRAAINAEQAKQELTLVERRLSRTEAELKAIKQGFLFRIASLFGGGGSLSRLKVGRSRRALLAQQLELIRESHLFDSDWYLATYPDVAEARIDPASHYLGEGWREGRNPGPEFSSNGYLKANRDIAAAGLNPLVHYLEHGIAEGRLAGDVGPAVARRSIEDFGPAAPVFRASFEATLPVRWIRHYQLDPSVRTLVRIGNELAGYQPEADIADLGDRLARFWKLSGLADDAPTWSSSTGEPSGVPAAVMADCWFIGRLMLRTRWNLPDGEGIVVRGYQRDGRECLPRLIGEAVVTTPLDVADFTLANPLLPTLFVVCRPDGEVIGALLLTFPSLCRGGLHYAELLVAPDQANVCAITAGDRYARQLEAILEGREAALVQSIRADLAGADGTHPMFQSDLQDWLDLVMRVDIAIPAVHESLNPASADFINERIASGARHAERSSASAILVVPSDSVPTIGGLVAAAGVGEAVEPSETNVSFLIAQSDPAKTTLAIELPRSSPLPAGRSSWAAPLPFPRMAGSRALPVDLHAAIRNAGGRQLAESELLQPVAQPLEILTVPAAARALIVVVEAELWTLPALEAGLGALRLQRGSDDVRLCLLNPNSECRALAESAFPGRTATRPDFHAFVEGLGDEDVLHLGPGVILHDDRTLMTFQSLLADAGAASASCPIIACARHGKGWAVTVDDAGAVVIPGTSAAEPMPLAPLVDALWASVIPVRAQPRNLWAARAEVLRNAPDEAVGAHLCCNLITASYFNGVADELATVELPFARTEHALRVQALVG